MSATQYLKGFSWPVPVAFAGAVSACRFEQGDVLYSAKAGYRTWGSAVPDTLHVIQVLDPPRGNRALTSDQEGGRFLANWNSDVTLQILEVATSSSHEQTTSQGRLFTFLWHGVRPDLDAESPSPPPPRLGRDLHRVIDQALPVFRRHFAKNAPAGGGGMIYVAAVDLSSDTSRVKASGIEAALAQRFGVVARDVAPNRAGLEAGEGFHPALVLRGLFVAGGAVEEVEAMLKGRLYGGDEGKAGRFSVGRHGVLAEAVEGVVDGGDEG